MPTVALVDGGGTPLGTSYWHATVRRVLLGAAGARTRD
ncbi:hypothetical protein FHR34_007828 [Kitasatospora kifunensis]|uniref:Uncharacterized protein n=1 Tax=Kitasatospora kifunensis TaxID=58351 RepID=A0A7W7RB55_KITKI|nr:hypothetical protein [Kitasatospora kifunensis]